MTLILSCLTPRYAIQVSDRRLVCSNGGLCDDHSNKAILVNGHVVFGYTGLALIDGKTRTDDWFVDALSGSYRADREADFTTTAHRIAERAAAAIASTGFPPALKRLAFVGVGWCCLPPGRDLVPVYTVISNSHSGDGKWMPEARPDFVVLHFGLPEDAQVLIMSDGQPLEHDLRRRLHRQVNTCVAKGTGPRPIARLLVDAARRTAGINPNVGRNLLVNCIPRESVRMGSAKLVAAGPVDKVATFFYVPDRATKPVQYGPHFFAYGASFSGISVWQHPVTPGGQPNA